MRSTGRTAWLSVALALGSACASTTELDDFPDALSVDADAGAAAARGDASCIGENGPAGSLYEECVGHNDASRGTCSTGEICGSLPDVGYNYCMPSLPCPAGMVSVINLACAYPCEGASDCDAHGLARCAENTLAQFTSQAFGWCTP